jgi:uncharacterized membrane protein
MNNIIWSMLICVIFTLVFICVDPLWILVIEIEL